MNLINLFEPKLPPINLLCLPPASWFYRGKSSEVARSSHRALKSVDIQAVRDRILAQHNGRV